MKLNILLTAIVAVLAIGNVASAQSEKKADQGASATKKMEKAGSETKEMEKPGSDSKMAAKADIVDTAVSAGKFSTLVAAVKAAGLVETLKGAGPFTVFAPNDAAFGKLPLNAVQDLLKPENKEKLTSILTYHVVAGKVMAADVVKLTEAKTVNGKTVTIKVSDDGVMLDSAKVIKTDIECGNGVIHVIDSVIMP